MKNFQNRKIATPISGFLLNNLRICEMTYFDPFSPNFGPWTQICAFY